MVDSSAQRGSRSPFSHIGRECGFVCWGIRARYVALSLVKLTSLCNCCSALKIVFCATACFFMRSTADNFASQTAVDIFNRVTGMWSTAQLSLQRRAMGATSVGNMALFAGGGVADGMFVMVVAECVVDCVGVHRMCLQQQYANFILPSVVTFVRIITHRRRKVEYCRFVQRYSKDMVCCSV